MGRFEVEGIGEKTGRKRKRIYEAKNETDAISLANNDGTIISKVSELRPAPPTENQLNYAERLGVAIPEKASTLDASHILGNKERDDCVSSKKQRDFVMSLGVEFSESEYIGQNTLYETLLNALVLSGKEEDLLRWITLSIYHSLPKNKRGTKVATIDNEIIKKISTDLAQNKKVTKSAQNYGWSNLFFFREDISLAESGFSFGGEDSKGSIAYKEIHAYLLRELNFVSNDSKPTLTISPSAESEDKSSMQGFLVHIVLYIKNFIKKRV